MNNVLIQELQNTIKKHWEFIETTKNKLKSYFKDKIFSIKLVRFQICQPCLKYPEKQVISVPCPRKRF